MISYRANTSWNPSVQITLICCENDFWLLQFPLHFQLLFHLTKLILPPSVHWSHQEQCHGGAGITAVAQQTSGGLEISQPSQRMSKSPISLSLFSLHAYIVSFQGPIKPCSGSRVTRLNNTYQLDSRALITLPRDQQKQKKKVRKRKNIAIKNNNVLNIFTFGLD